MSKHKQRGRALFKGFDFTVFLHRFLLDARDIEPDLKIIEELILLVDDPVRFKSRVSSGLEAAEPTNCSGASIPTYILLRQVEALYKKNPDWGALPAKDRRKNAQELFDSNELSCKRANKRISFYRKHWSRQSFACEAINLAALRVQEIIGHVTPAILDEIFEESRHGNGATLEHKMDRGELYFKLSEGHTITKAARPWLQKYLASSPRLYDAMKEERITEVQGNRVSFVPKDDKIDRTIAIEPSWNMFFQLGVDGFLKKRLRKFGVDLKRQDRNHQPAREGSLGSSIATLDLSSASDRISIEAVKWLLPPSWYTLCDSLRCSHYVIRLGDGDSLRKYEKFSTMGNGITFGLESLIFYSLAWACCTIAGEDPSSIRVYGDDMIIPSSVYALCTEALSFLGFSVNRQKSFAFGTFRESCGRDYLLGINVRPVYVRRNPSNVEHVYSLYNRLLIGSWIKLKRALLYLRSCVRSPHEGPLSMGNSTLDIDKILSGKIPKWTKTDQRLESYFISNPFSDRDYNHDLQRFQYRTLILDKRMKPVRGCTVAHALYSAFLYNGVEHVPASTRDIKWFQREVFFEHWDDLRHLGDWQMDSRMV